MSEMNEKRSPETATLKSYAMTLDYGEEAKDPTKHLAALLEEARHEIDNLPPDGDKEGLRAWGYDLIQRDALISRCALILAHRLLQSPLARPLQQSEDFEQIEIALEHLYRG